MKATITGWLILNAIDYVRRANDANTQNLPDDEVRFSIGAHLMIALAIEGISNEVGEALFDAWTWERLEKNETVLKWRLLSGLGGRKAFDPGKEPLQSVRHLATVRNEIAHPKVRDGGDEIIVRSKTGDVRRNVPDDEKLNDGDTVYFALGKLLDKYNSKAAAEGTRRGIAAIKKLRDHLEMSGLDWIERTERDFEEAVRKGST
jgi:hypothetical protein